MESGPDCQRRTLGRQFMFDFILKTEDYGGTFTGMVVPSWLLGHSLVSIIYGVSVEPCSVQ